ncbi:hypothetical protein DFJ74DRAFT_708457 [Hyaloraphidium curvatum]|nr:hypothetical protein DFJ74DRAFT_708457 [Hyaloraphidium curvatum]
MSADAGPLRVAVIGGGWYGCHIAAALLALGHTAVVLERGPRLFSGSSGANQFRLHAGFHYPRCARTRRQVAAALGRFLAAYPRLVAPLAANIYAVAARSSLLDFETYATVLRHDGGGAPFDVIDPAAAGLAGVEGALLCREPALLADAPRAHFERVLGGAVQCGRSVACVASLRAPGGEAVGAAVDGERFDWVVDATYGQLDVPVPRPAHFFEVCLTLVYRRLAEGPAVARAFTIMDGDFCSLFPYFSDSEDAELDRRRLHTLTHVRHTHLARFGRFEDAAAFAASFGEADALRSVPLFEDAIVRFLPAFREEYRYHSYFLSFKTKIPGRTDGRETVCTHEGRVISVMSGKVSTVFVAEDYVLDVMGLAGKREPGKEAVAGVAKAS